MTIAAIAAVDENWGIGYQGQLLEHIPEDMKYFKELTTNKIVVMGRKTQESLPQKKLENRVNIVLTNQDANYENDIIYGSLKDIHWLIDWFKIYECGFEKYQSYTDRKLYRPKDIFIIGGASTYEQLLPCCDKLYITKIYKTHENVDTYFPQLGGEEWEIESESELKEYEGIQYQFVVYKRKT